MQIKCICFFLFLGEDIPIFPTQDKYLAAVKQRVNLAREVDKLQLQVRKVNSEEGWLQKAAKEMDIIIDGMYPFFIFFAFLLNKLMFLNK